MPFSNYQVLVNEFRITRVTIRTKHKLINKIRAENAQNALKKWYFYNLMLDTGPTRPKIPPFVKILSKYRIWTLLPSQSTLLDGFKMVYFTKIELKKPQKPKIAQNAHSGPLRPPKMVFFDIFDLKIGFPRPRNVL